MSERAEFRTRGKTTNVTSKSQFSKQFARRWWCFIIRYGGIRWHTLFAFIFSLGDNIQRRSNAEIFAFKVSQIFLWTWAMKFCNSRFTTINFGKSLNFSSAQHLRELYWIREYFLESSGLSFLKKKERNKVKVHAH